MILAKMRSGSIREVSLLLINWRTGLILFLILAALGIRLFNADEPPLNFHATRQYRSLLLARAYYYESQPAIPEWKREVARTNQERQGILEPPIMEMLVAQGYRLLGGERFWIPRLFSSLVWIMGGGVLYQMTKKIAGENAGLFSMAFYLFLPFAVVASTSFQPDPLMVMMLLASILAILRYFENPSMLRLVGCIVLSASSVFIKPVSLFVIYTVFGLLALHKHGAKGFITNHRLILFLPITLLPTLIFYLYGIFLDGVLRDQAQASFLPQLLITSFFWRGWLNNIREVIGFTALIGSLLGVLSVQKGLYRFLLIGSWGGYVFSCLVFNYHIATHDYYHLQLIPIVALSLGPIAALICERLLKANPEWYWRMAIGFILAIALFVSLFIAQARLINRDYESQVETAEEIGELVKHSLNTVYLASDYGLSLEYHGELSGIPWPLVSDLDWERLAGVPVLDAETRFHHMFAGELPQYFIVEDLDELRQQKDLQQFLEHHFVALVDHGNYVVYELR